MRDHDQDSASGPERAAAKRRADTSSAAVQRALAAGSADRLGPGDVTALQRSAGNEGVISLMRDERDEASPVHELLRGGGGNALDDDTRGFMEQRMGHDFSSVRVHTGAQANQSAESVQANAYTVGDNVVFRSGQYDPGSDSGRRTIAHELTHVVQQRQGPVEGTPQAGGVKVSTPGDPFEREAESTADAVMRVADSTVQRQAEEEEEELQTTPVQRQAEEEEEELQMMPIQRQAEEEEEEIQATPVQRQAEEEEEELQMMPVQRQAEQAEEEELAG